MAYWVNITIGALRAMTLLENRISHRSLKEGSRAALCLLQDEVGGRGQLCDCVIESAKQDATFSKMLAAGLRSNVVAKSCLFVGSEPHIL